MIVILLVAMAAGPIVRPVLFPRGSDFMVINELLVTDLFEGDQFLIHVDRTRKKNFTARYSIEITYFDEALSAWIEAPFCSYSSRGSYSVGEKDKPAVPLIGWWLFYGEEDSRNAQRCRESLRPDRRYRVHSTWVVDGSGAIIDHVTLPFWVRRARHKPELDQVDPSVLPHVAG